MLSTLNVIARHHNTCEDSLFVKSNSSYIFGVIADGCSTGIKSAFASQAIAYAVETYLPALNTRNESVLLLRDTLIKLKELFQFSHMNLLSTCTLFCYDIHNKQLRIRLFGDGTFYVNDIEFNINQDNKPDYLGYHLLDDSVQFNKYLTKHPESIFDNVDRFMICSDGIANIERSILQIEPTKNPNELLFKPPTSENYLQRMWNILKRDGYTLSDDLTIVSYAG